MNKYFRVPTVKHLNSVVSEIVRSFKILFLVSNIPILFLPAIPSSFIVQKLTIF